MSDYTDYIDRTVDLVAFSGPFPSATIPLTMALANEGEGGQLQTGILKLAQKFMLLLLTPIGSIPGLPLSGCDFMPKLQQGLLRTTLDVYAAFSSAVSDIKIQILAEESTTMPDDERFSSAVIIKLRLTADSASITLQITSLAGSSRKVVLPLSITV